MDALSKHPISRELLGKIVDEVFDGAIEDASVIEQIYAVVKEHETPAPVDHELKVTGFRGNPTRVVLSSGHEATITQKLIDAFATPAPVDRSVWSQEDAERENKAFAEWFKDRGYPNYPGHYPLITENAMHAAWQEAAKRSALSAALQAPVVQTEAQEGVGWTDHIINLQESSEAIQKLIYRAGNIGGKLHYRRDKLRELATVLSALAAQEGVETEEAWEELCNMDDRTSPAEYPDMCLITKEELSTFMKAASPPPAGYVLVPLKMTAAMINAWSGGTTVTTDEIAYRTHFQDAWARVLSTSIPPDIEHKQGGEEQSKDKARLDFLDECNKRLNARYGTTYRWELILNHNVNRLMLGSLKVDLNDAAANGVPSCREAIDKAMERIAISRIAPSSTPDRSEP